MKTFECTNKNSRKKINFQTHSTHVTSIGVEKAKMYKNSFNYKYKKIEKNSNSINPINPK